jgi:transcriptional regulator with XRE-family HTH domain
VDVDRGGFGARLRALREAVGLSQQELADRSGLSIRAVGYIECSRTQWPYRDSLTRLADALVIREAAQAEFLGAVPAVSWHAQDLREDDRRRPWITMSQTPA